MSHRISMATLSENTGMTEMELIEEGVNDSVCYALCDEECRVEPGTEQLQAHHLNCWAKFPEERFLIENGVALTVKEHRRFHSIYGNQTTRQQYKIYKEKYIDL